MSFSDQPDFSIPSLGPISKDSRVEWRSQLSNNGPTPTMQATNLLNYRGKFFPRGCRGFISSIEVYIENNAAPPRNLELYLSPQPEMGPAYQNVHVVAGNYGPGWYACAVNEMWNYDSLFILVHSDDNTRWTIGYDTGTPWDGYYSPIWYNQNDRALRYWIRVIFTGETAGDVPVSGTINNIEIPSISSRRDTQTLAVPAGASLYDAEQNGAGELLIAYFFTSGDAAMTWLVPRILCDGNQVLPIDAPLANWNTQYISSDSLGICISKWDAQNEYYCMCVEIPYPFRNRLQLGYTNIDPANPWTGFIAYAWKQIS